MCWGDGGGPELHTERPEGSGVFQRGWGAEKTLRDPPKGETGGLSRVGGGVVRRRLTQKLSGGVQGTEELRDWNFHGRN